MKRRTVASLNMNPLWPDGYFEVLTELQVPPRQHPFHAHWIRRFVHYHCGRNPSTMGGAEIHQFLSHLALNETVAASTQNQALNGLVFLYRHVLKTEPGDFGDFPRARRPKRLPVVLSRQEVQDVFARLDGVELLLARLLYGSGMRVSEGLRLRVQDISFDRSEITARAGKGDKDRRVARPCRCEDDDNPGLRERLELKRRLIAEGTARRAPTPRRPSLGSRVPPRPP